MEKIKLGIIICDRYRTCAGGKCFRAAAEREGAFSVYKDKEIEIAAFTTCGGCPGGNIEYVPEEMIKNGVDAIHFATGMIVGYPPCPYITQFKEFVETHYKVPVVIGTHPIPLKYYNTHNKLSSWVSMSMNEICGSLLSEDKNIMESYN